MQERIIEAIVYLLTEMQQERSRKDKINLTHALLLKGYTEVEINLAFSWIFNHLQNPPHESILPSENQDDLDQLDDLDELVIAPDAYGYLLQLLNLGVVRENDMQIIIERALAYGKDDINLDDLKSIVASIIFGLDEGYPLSGYAPSNGNSPIQ
jgi:uncharacterized protein Smg (DUF494 family)